MRFKALTMGAGDGDGEVEENMVVAADTDAVALLTAIGPQGPLLKNDGPACRVCGCTEHNACAMWAAVQTGKRTVQEMTIGCSWVKVEPGSSKPLCSACMGTAADMAEAFRRQLRVINGEGPPRRRLDKAFAIGQAALLRYRKVKNRS